MSKVVFVVGKRTINGTDWPVENQVTKNGNKWLVTFGLCNGVADDSQLFARKKDAMEAAEPEKGMADVAGPKVVRIQVIRAYELESPSGLEGSAEEWAEGLKTWEIERVGRLLGVTTEYATTETD